MVNHTLPVCREKTVETMLWRRKGDHFSRRSRLEVGANCPPLTLAGLDDVVIEGSDYKFRSIHSQLIARCESA